MLRSKSMRAIILGLSLLCYALAAFITTAAWLIPKARSAATIAQTTVERSSEINLEEENEPASYSIASETQEAIPPRDAGNGSSKRDLRRPPQAEAAVDEDAGIPSDTGTGVVVAVLGDGLFRPGRHLLTPELKAAVDEILPVLVAHPAARIVVEGHTDNLPLGPGSRYANNRELSLLRAEAVVELLEEKGISSERLSMYGYGSSRPVSSNTTPIGRAQNRRVEIRMIPPISTQ